VRQTAADIQVRTIAHAGGRVRMLADTLENTRVLR